MKQGFFIDHHIQSSVLGILLQEGPKSFSGIKPAGLENSLFMYHVRKLLARGLVEKNNGMFQLTPEGARWLNKVGLGSSAIDTPRCLVQLLILKDDQILISERREHLAEHMNKFLLPGGLHKLGLTSRASAKVLAEKMGIENLGELITQVELIIPEKNHHSIADIYIAEVNSTDFEFIDELYDVRFVPQKDVLSMSVDRASNLPEILRKYLDNSLNAREEFLL